jgi:hypothetical protein
MGLTKGRPSVEKAQISITDPQEWSEFTQVAPINIALPPKTNSVE